MRILNSIALVCIICLNSCGQTNTKRTKMNSTEHKYTNKLINESSPYLLQHAHNPVNWYPWGKEALGKAQKENKLIIVSIGYAACHWCHVMEHESFEDEEIAKYMNENYISIKVDREERPDIDQVYMNAVQLLTGSGGWPLNCIALPDGRPIYGGTYFRKEQWIDILAKVQEFVKENPDKAEQQAKALTEGVQSSEMIYMNSEKSEFSENNLDRVFSTMEKYFDNENGGTNGAPKFPLPIGYQFLMNYHFNTKNDKALNAVILTLDKMAHGGIYDQIGGGFARYSVDADWKVPHFEKMLYDNAQLVSLYSAAYQKTKDLNYKAIVEETLEFIQTELTSKDGGFYSSLDADSEGEEGKFYVWTYNEIIDALGANADLIIEYYNITENGNWEDSKNILLKSDNNKKLSNKYKITEKELAKKVSEAKGILLKEREKRIRPNLDDKIITSWNALMIKGFVDAYKAFGNEKWLHIALKNAEFIDAKIKQTDFSLYRNYKNGKASINGFLDDYAFIIEAYISLYQVTFDEKWLNNAKQLTEYAIEHFYDNYTGMFFYTSDIDAPLIARKMEVTDNVIPSSNSQMAKNLFMLGHYFYNDGYIKKSEKMLNNVKDNALKGGAYYANWNILMSWFVNIPYEVAIVGNDFKAKLRDLNKHFLPNMFLSGGKQEGNLKLLEGKYTKGQTTIYVCRNKACKLPVIEVDEALKQVLE
jgi:uncharacterized protein